MSGNEEQVSSAQLNMLSNQLAALQNKMEKAELDRERKALAEGKSSSRPWWVAVVEILALPAAFIAIVVQFTAASGNVQSNAKTEAETAKIRVEEVKTRVELQNMLDDLATKKANGMDSFRVEAEALLPKIDATIEKLRTLDSATAARSLNLILVKYVMLWVIFHFIGLIFDVVEKFWSTFMGVVSNVIFSWRFKRKDGKEDYERSTRLRKYFTFASIVLVQVPSVLRWSISLSVFIALMVPLFNEASTAIGSRASFDVITEAARNFDVSAALLAIKQVLFVSAP